MGVLKLRATGLEQDIKAISQFLRATSGSSGKFRIVEESKDYPNRNSLYVRRYLELEVNWEDLKKTD